MRFVLLVMGFILIGVVKSIGQHTTLIFNIFEAVSKIPVSGATIKLFGSNNNFFNYGISDNNGRISLEIVREKLPIKFEVTHINFRVYRDSIKNQNEQSLTLYVSLDRIEKRLPTVVISSDILFPYDRKDTIEVATSDAKKANVNRVSDLLQNLEGFRQDAQGKLTYRGQSVTHVLVDGIDYSKSDYNSVLSGLSASIIDTLQIIKHYNENPLLRGKISSTGLAVNLKIDRKAKIKPAYNGELGGSNRNQVHGGLSVFIPSQKKLFAFGQGGTNAEFSKASIAVDPPFNIHSAFYNSNYDEALLPVQTIYFPPLANLSLGNWLGVTGTVMGGLNSDAKKPVTYNLDISNHQPDYQSSSLSIMNFDSLKLIQNNIRDESLEKSQVKLLINNTALYEKALKPIAITSSLKLALNEQKSFQSNFFSGNYNYLSHETFNRKSWTIAQTNIFAIQGRGGKVNSITLFGQNTVVNSKISTHSASSYKNIDQQTNGNIVCIGSSYLNDVGSKLISNFSINANYNALHLVNKEMLSMPANSLSNLKRWYFGIATSNKFKFEKKIFTTNIETGIYILKAKPIWALKLNSTGKINFKRWSFDTNLEIDNSLLDIDKYLDAKIYMGQQRFLAGSGIVKTKTLYGIGESIRYSNLVSGLTLATNFGYELVKNDLVYEPRFENNFTYLIVKQAKVSNSYKADLDFKTFVFPLKLTLKFRANLIWSTNSYDSSLFAFRQTKSNLSFVKAWKKFQTELFSEFTYSTVRATSMSDINQVNAVFGAKMRLDTKWMFFGTSANIYAFDGQINPIIDCSFARQISKKVKLNIAIANFLNKKAFVTKRVQTFSEQTMHQPLKGIVIYPKVVVNL